MTVTATTLDKAVISHARWKATFRLAIEGREAMDEPTISADNCCALGLWLYGDGQTAHGTRPEFVQLVADHKAFHSEAGKVAKAINNQAFEQASAMLNHGTSFGHASSVVILSITNLKRVAN